MQNYAETLLSSYIFCSFILYFIVLYFEWRQGKYKNNLQGIIKSRFVR